MKIKSFLFALLTIVLFSCNVRAQGQIFTKAEANAQFGSVLSSIPVSKAAFKQASAQCSTRVLFAITRGNAVIATPKKQTLFSTSNATTESLQAENITYRVVAKTTLDEFLSRSTEDTVYIEQRATVYTLTSGDVTLERTMGCPPECDTN